MINEKQEKCILTIKGPISMPQSLSNVLVFAHENLSPQVHNHQSKPLTLQTLQFHRDNPLTLQNTSLTATLFEHEVLSASQKSHVASQKIYIVSSSRTPKPKTPELLSSKYTVIKGYNIELPESLNTANTVLGKEVELLVSLEHMEKEIEYEFRLSEEKNGLLGEICLEEEIEKGKNNGKYWQAFQNLFEAYTRYSEKNDCPIFINLLKNGSKGYHYLNKGEGEESGRGLSESISFLSTRAIRKKEKMILINPSFIFKQESIENGGGHVICYSNMNHGLAEGLYTAGYNICFDLLRYSRDRNSLTHIAYFLKKYPQQTILSSGLTFKTDLQQFGGEGLIVEESVRFIAEIMGVENSWGLINESMNSNVMRLLCWFVKKIVVKEVRMWRCVKCEKQSPESEEAFRKFGKDFCSIGCLKSYKF